MRATKRWSWLFMGPVTIAFVIGFVWPFIQGIYLSFCNFKTTSHATFVGLSNYVAAFADSSFQYSFWYTAATAIISLVVINVIAFAVAKGYAHLDTAMRVARELVVRQLADPWPEPVLLNVNIPSVPYEELKGYEVTRLGRRHHTEPVIPALNPRGETVYWIGKAGPVADNGEGTDFHATAQGKVSISPLQIDLTSTTQLEKTRQWLA